MIDKNTKIPHVCHEHNTCADCGKNKEDCHQPHWGHKKGFICSVCFDVADALRKEEVRLQIETFQATEPDEIHFWGNDEIVCPHCGHKNEPDCDDFEADDDDYECSVCELCFTYTAIHTTTWTPAKKDK